MYTFKFYPLVLFFFFMTSYCNGQSYFGITAGSSLNQLKLEFLGEELEVYNSLFGYHIGAFYGIKVEEGFYIRPEIKYVRRGAVLDFENLESNFRKFSDDSYDKTIMHYIELPIFLSYQDNKFRVYAGPYLGACLRVVNKFDVKITDIDPVTLEISTVRDNDKNTIKPVLGKASAEDYEDGVINALDLGVELGLGYSFGLLELGLSYNHGLANLVKDDPSTNRDERDDSITRNRSFRLNFNYTIEGKKEVE